MAHTVSYLVFLVIIWEVSPIQIHPGFKNYFSSPYSYTEKPYPPVYQPPRYADPPPQYYPPVTSVPGPEKTLEAPPVISQPPILQALNTSLVNESTGKIDPAILNNLAVALQLLIVHNLLSNQSTSNNIETSIQPTVVPPSVPYASPRSLDHYCPSGYEHIPNQMPPQIPDAKFIGNSNFADCGNSLLTGPFIPPYTPRICHNLKSPYEILATPTSPFDNYVPNYKSDFQSPYAMLTESSYTQDLFSF